MLEWWIASYHWAENHFFWNYVLGWGIGITLNAIWAVRLLVITKAKAAARHQEINDKLDVNTPGGLADVVKALKGDVPPDDGGSQEPIETEDDERRKRGNGPHGHNGTAGHGR